jgi:hypothetical protein
MTGKKVDELAAKELPRFMLTNVGEEATLRVLTAPRVYGFLETESNIACRCEVLLNSDSANSMVIAPEHLMAINSTLYKGMVMELKKNDIIVDKHLECLVGLVWTIRVVEWIDGPKEKWTIDDVTKMPVAPKTLLVKLRKDLELKGKKDSK